MTTTKKRKPMLSVTGVAHGKGKSYMYMLNPDNWKVDTGSKYPALIGIKEEKGRQIFTDEEGIAEFRKLKRNKKK